MTLTGPLARERDEPGEKLLRVLDWRTATPAARAAALARPPRGRDPALAARVRQIFADVAAEGARAVARWAVELDGHPPRTLAIDAAALTAARAATPPEDQAALAFAADVVRRYHDATRPADGPTFETAPGATVRRVHRAISPVGLYVPGGTAPLFSTLLMLAIPAAVAGCAERVAITPPQRDGSAHPLMILAAHAAGLTELHLVGGAHGIAALALGAGLPACAKLFGPGNAWVAEAKRHAAELPAGPPSDMPAGPSELMVVADLSSDPARVAADLLAQAEHDRDAQVLLVTPDAALVPAVATELAAQLATLPRRAIAEAALAHARAILADDVLAVVNAYAPEHLSLQSRNAEALVAGVHSAGTIFVGPHAAETFGDYLSGPSHVLPTDGAARAWSGVSVASFMTSIAVQRATAAGAAALAAPAARLARAEGLEAHARAADVRA